MSCTLKTAEKQGPVEAQKAAYSDGWKFTGVPVEPGFRDPQDAGGLRGIEESSDVYGGGLFAHSRGVESFRWRRNNELGVQSALVSGAHCGNAASWGD